MCCKASQQLNNVLANLIKKCIKLHCFILIKKFQTYFKALDLMKFEKFYNGLFSCIYETLAII